MGVGAFASGIFHLYTHAFFKALLFLGSGAVIHALAGEQDLRRMGGLRKALPITYWTFVAGAIAISGVPGFAGFFSKDEILSRTYTSGHRVLWAVGLFTALLTAIYMFRLVFLAFHGERAPAPAAPEHPEEEEPAAHAAHGTPAPHASHGSALHDAPPAMAFALIVLAIGSVVAGYVGLGGRFEQFLAPSFGPPVAEAVVEGASESVLMAASIVTAFLGILIAAWYFLKHRAAADALARKFAGLHTLLMNKYYVDEIYDATVVQPIHIVSEEGLWHIVDVNVIDGAVNGVAETVGGSSEILRRLQTGSVRAYAVSLFAGAVLILGFYLWR
jgi:NADH-quinone oxidoreductase subunit L